MKILITRPVEDSKPLAARLRAMGIDSLTEPLMAIRVLADAPLELDGVQAILATSANGVRAFAQRNSRRDIPLYAVGDATARAARAAGFARVESADGDVVALAARVRDRLDPNRGALLHVAGSVVAKDLSVLLKQDGFVCRRAVLYEAVPVESLSLASVRAIRAGRIAGILLFSPRTADVFVRLARRARLMRACGALTLFALSPAVARKAAPIRWRDRCVAAEPTQAALLDTLRMWCASGPAGRRRSGRRATVKKSSTYGRS